MNDPTERPNDASPAVPPGTIRDLRVKPRGVLPRHVQMWLMVGIAIVILAIIVFSGHPQPEPRPQANARPAQPTLVPPERVRSYEQQLAADLAREQQELQQVQNERSAKAIGATAGLDPRTDDERRREYQSLFADNVALSRRSADRQTYAARRQPDTASSVPGSAKASDLNLIQQLLARRGDMPEAPSKVPSETATPAIPARPASPSDESRHAGESESVVPPKDTPPIRSSDPLQRLLEGTVIETVLANRLDGTFSGPVECLVTTPVYSHDRQSILVPAGAKVLGEAAPVQTWGDSRLAVSFHRLVMPDGRTYSLDRFKGLGQIGDTGLKDSVDHHYLQVFGASLAIGALSGLAQYGTRSGIDQSFGDSYRQAAGSSLAASAGRVLDRYLNVLPTITIREGYRIKIYLTNDFLLPAYVSSVAGGAR